MTENVADILKYFTESIFRTSMSLFQNPVPLVDRERGDPRNILGVIVNRNLDTDNCYKGSNS